MKSQVNQDVVLQILTLQRQSKLDEVAGRIQGRLMVWEAFQLHGLCQGPHHTPGAKEQKVWPNEKLTHITYRSIPILKHPSFNKTQDLETGDTALAYSIFASSFYQSLRSIDSFSLNQAVFFLFLGVGRGRGMVWKHHSCSFSFPPPP